MADDLSPKQKQFCLEYIVDFNGTQAAIRAGYSEKGASQQGSVLLANPNIQEELARCMQERSQSTKITAEWVLEESKKSYVYNAQEVFDADGNPKMINAPAASKFLEMCGKHTNVKAYVESTQQQTDNVFTINLVDAKKPD